MQQEWIYTEPTFRMAAEPKLVTDCDDNLVMLTQCVERIGGRWDPFYSYAIVACAER